MTLTTKLNYAIANKKTISFKYNNLDRIVEPHHYGILNNVEQLHCYQTGGKSKSRSIPEWRNFKLEKIKDLAVNDTVFTPRQSYNPSNSHYQNIIKRI